MKAWTADGSESSESQTIFTSILFSSRRRHTRFDCDCSDVCSSDLDERQEDGDSKHTILSLIANRITDELLKHVAPSYKASIIKTVGFNTHFKAGATQMNCNIEF